MYLDRTFGLIQRNHFLAEVDTFAQPIGSAKVKSKSEVTQCSSCSRCVGIIWQLTWRCFVCSLSAEDLQNGVIQLRYVRFQDVSSITASLLVACTSSDYMYCVYRQQFIMLPSSASLRSRHFVFVSSIRVRPIIHCAVLWKMVISHSLSEYAKSTIFWLVPMIPLVLIVPNFYREYILEQKQIRFWDQKAQHWGTTA